MLVFILGQFDLCLFSDMLRTLDSFPLGFGSNRIFPLLFQMTFRYRHMCVIWGDVGTLSTEVIHARSPQLQLWIEPAIIQSIRSGEWRRHSVRAVASSYFLKIKHRKWEFTRWSFNILTMSTSERKLSSHHSSFVLYNNGMWMHFKRKLMILQFRLGIANIWGNKSLNYFRGIV